MSQMGLLAESLELDWTPTAAGYKHIGGRWEILVPKYGKGTVHLAFGSTMVLSNVELHTAVAHVLRSA